MKTAELSHAVETARALTDGPVMSDQQSRPLWDTTRAVAWATQLEEPNWDTVHRLEQAGRDAQQDAYTLFAAADRMKRELGRKFDAAMEAARVKS